MLGKILSNPFLKFLVVFSLLLIVWLSFYKLIYNLDGTTANDPNHFGIEQRLSYLLGIHASWFMSVFGYTGTLEMVNDLVITGIEGYELSHGTWIGEPCNGLKIMGLFAIFIIAFPGKWIHKTWFILCGIILIHVTNAMRIAGLTIIEAKHPEYLDFNHNVTFQVIVYSVIFSMWFLWTKYFSSIELNRKNVQQ